MNLTALKNERVAELKTKCAEIMENLHIVWQKAAADIRSAPETGNTVCFPGSTAYLFNSAGVRWMMDAAYYTYPSEQENRMAAELLKDFSFGIFTHCHGDHFQPEMLNAMTDSGVKWILGRAVREQFRSWLPDFPEDNLIWMEDFQEVILHGIRIVCLPGMHAEPGKPLVPSASFAVYLQDGTSMLFPADCRYFDLPELPSECFDYVFGHVYLGRTDNTLNDFPQFHDFTRMLLAANARNVFLTHLYEFSRAPEDMWTNRHAEMVKAELLKHKPDLNVAIPERGFTASL